MSRRRERANPRKPGFYIPFYPGAASQQSQVRRCVPAIRKPENAKQVTSIAYQNRKATGKIHTAGAITTFPLFNCGCMLWSEEEGSYAGLVASVAEALAVKRQLGTEGVKMT